jgi:plastocyanin
MCSAVFWDLSRGIDIVDRYFDSKVTTLMERKNLARDTKRIAMLLFSIFASTLATQNVLATAHLVNVGQPLNSFTPQTLTITVGDTVTFVNKGGEHNVVADDNSFICAMGCDGDGHGGSGKPSSAPWTATVTFSTVGDVGYYCEIHGQPGGGMFGTIHVNATTPIRLQSFGVD